MQKEVDFSSVVITLMKSLEYEMKIRFLYGYLYYLHAEVPVDEYISDNSLSPTTKRYNPYNRGMILFQARDGDIEYIIPETKDTDFTLGSFKYVVGMMPNQSGREITGQYTLPDASAVKYCEQKLMCRKSVEANNGGDWLSAIVNKIDSITALRNDAAHGGVILSRMSAESAFMDLIRIKKILVNLVDGSDSAWIDQVVETRERRARCR